MSYCDGRGASPALPSPCSASGCGSRDGRDSVTLGGALRPGRFSTRNSGSSDMEEVAEPKPGEKPSQGCRPPGPERPSICPSVPEQGPCPESPAVSCRLSPADRPLSVCCPRGQLWSLVGEHNVNALTSYFLRVRTDTGELCPCVQLAHTADARVSSRAHAS